MEELSPMMQQYMAVKEQHKDHIIFFRLGDFYEMFFDDAILAAKELELTLTGRDCGMKERAPMCGVPYHSCEPYIARLIKKGYKVAICEQVEDPKTAKGIVKREIIRVITPGTLIEANMLDEGTNNYIASLYNDKNFFGAAFVDVSTGEVFATEFEDIDNSKIRNEISRFSPKEIVFNGAFLDKTEVTKFIKDKVNCCVECMDDNIYIQNNIESKICKQFNAQNLFELSMDGKKYAALALIAALNYINETHKNGLERIITLSVYSGNQFMVLDSNARRNLELTETMLTKDKKGSLLWVIDKTKTPMGKRLIRSWIEKPLVNPIVINKRINAVDELFNDNILREELNVILSGIYDIERLMTRIVYGSTGPRELKSLEQTAKKLPQLKERIKDTKSDFLQEIYNDIDLLEDMKELIEISITDDPPVTLKDGWVIKVGYNEELDNIRSIITDTKKYLAKIETDEREKTGIKNLKIGYNKVFGYYIEISRGSINMAPDRYIRKQTLANCERYITQELKELEEQISSAGDKMYSLEQELYEEVRLAIAGNLVRTQQTASAIAKLDVFASFATVSQNMHYARPIVNLSDIINIKDGRHPVVEAISQSSFVCNDTYLDRRDNQIAIITGPNMAGKSTYMRQTAIIVLLAQIGCFVPASYAEIGVIDGIFTRVGASDDLASGQSTFMVEMNEVASILKSATSNSLLILDEIGRGTSTFDGMSIARAVLEYISDRRKLGAKTLFATHYHELTDLEQQLDNVKNYNIAVKKNKDDIIFLRKIVPGGTDDSFGIEVSKLAGIPDWIIKRAFSILKELENNSAQPVKFTQNIKQENQISFENTIEKGIIADLKSIPINDITPREALNKLYDMFERLK
ncbi:MAG: DNA mismatch repair protein MutS [Oscillospiraceae bacterium]